MFRGPDFVLRENSTKHDLSFSRSSNPPNADYAFFGMSPSPVWPIHFITFMQHITHNPPWQTKRHRLLSCLITHVSVNHVFPRFIESSQYLSVLPLLFQKSRIIFFILCGTGPMVTHHVSSSLARDEWRDPGFPTKLSKTPKQIFPRLKTWYVWQ